MSDAGTPVVSDPGNIVCKTLREAGEQYTLIPGACAFVAALVLSALPADTSLRRSFIRYMSEGGTHGAGLGAIALDENYF